MTDTSSTRTQLFFSILALLILILIAYANTLFSPFNFDDQALLHQVHGTGSLFNQIWPVKYRHFLYYSFSVNHSLGGLDTFSYHLTNLLFHFLTSVVILLIVFKTLDKNTRWESKTVLGLSVTTAILFALNPLHTEAVTYISGRASGMGGFFYLLALLFLILGSERNSDPRSAYFTMALLVFFIALLSNETRLLFPLLVILIDLYFMRNEGLPPFKSRLLFIYLPLSILVGTFTQASGGFPYLLALLFFFLGSERNRNPVTATPLFYFLALLAFSFALLSKETALTFPLAVFLYDLCFMKNENWHPFKNRLLFIYLPLCFVVGALLILSPAMRSLIMEWFGKIDINYALAQGKILAYALKLCLFPINLTFDYDFPSNWFSQAFSRFTPVVIWLALVFTILKNFRRISPVVVFSILWFLITLSPTNSFLPRADLLSERNLYLPSLGPTFLIAFGFYHLFFMKQETSRSKQGLVILVTLFLLLGSLLITRNLDYRSNIHLWEDTYKKSPADLKVLHNLSHFYLEDKRYQQALVPLLRLSRSNAGDFYRAFAYSNLGSIYIQNGNLGRAERAFHKAIELEPTLPLGYLNLGTYFASRGEFRQARTEFLRAQERYVKYRWGYPMPAELDLNLARVNWQLKSFSDAKKHILQYLQVVPGSSDGLLLLGKIYQEEGENELAEKAYKEIQEGGLASAKAHNNLGILYINKNKYEKAQEAFNSSISFYPQLPDAHYNLGKLILDSKGSRALAKNHLELALSYNQSSSLKQEINRLLEQIRSP